MADRLTTYFQAAAGMLLLALATLFSAGCVTKIYDPDQATRPYPDELHRAESIDVHVFRDDTKIELINTSANTYRDFSIWLNQRYVHQVDLLEPGEELTLSLWDFWDERGERFNAGGFFRSYEPTPVRLVEIEPADGSPMIGLVAIRAEDIGPRGIRER